MKSKKEIKEWLLENCVDEHGNLDLSNLDFSDFEGDIYIDGIKVKNDLFQCSQIVQGDLYQNGQKVQRNLSQNCQEVKGDLYQHGQKVQRNLSQNCQEVKGDLYQHGQKVQGQFFTQNLKDDEEYIIDDFCTEIIKKPHKITYEELKEILGYDFELVDNEGKI